MYKIITLFLSAFLTIVLVACGGGGGSSGDSKQTSVSEASLAGPFIVRTSSVLNGQRVQNLLIPKQEAKVSTYGLKTTDITLQVTTKNSQQIITPTSVSIEDQNISFTVPPSIADGEISLIQDSKTLSTLPYKIYNSQELYITSIVPDTANPGDTISITGNAFVSSMQVMSKDSDLNISVTPNANQVSFTLPMDARSGDLYLMADEQESNTLYISIKRQLKVRVNPSSGLNIAYSDIGFAIGAAEYTLDSNFEATIPLENAYEQINATLEMPDGSFSHLYSAVILADMNGTISVDSMSTAISWIFLGLGASTVEESELRTLYDDVAGNAKVQALATYIDTLQKDDFSAYSQLSDPLLKTTFQDALVDVLQIQKNLSSARLAASLNSSAKLADTPSSSQILTITPQLNKTIYVNDTEYGYFYNNKLNNGSVTVVNDTQLYLSVEATLTDPDEDCMFETNSEGKCIINHYQHIQSPFKIDSSSIVKPSRGILGISNAKVFGIDGKDANLEIISAGSLDDTDKKNTAQILQLHTFIDGVVTPVLEMVLSPLLGKAIPSNHRYQHVIDGFQDIYGTDLIIAASLLLEDKDTTWGKALDTLMIKPVTKKLSSCVSLTPGDTCKKVLHGIAKLYGINSEAYVEQLTQKLIEATYDKVIKRVIVAVPVAGWVIEASIIAYEAYDTVSTVHLIAGSLEDMRSTKSEFNFDIDFHFEIDKVTPMCIGVSPSDLELSLYAKGEGFKIEGISEPEVYIQNSGGLKRVTTALDIPSNERIYATFDAQRLIDNRSVSALLFVDYGGFFVANNDYLQIVDQGDSIVHFDSIEPGKAISNSIVELKGCGWLPLNDIKVFFTTEDGEEEAEIIDTNITTITVKVPPTAVDGHVYATTGSKRTKNIYFEIEPFGLLEADIESIGEETEIVLYGENLEDVAKAFFIDYEENIYEGVVSAPSSSSVIVSIPSISAAGEIKVYVVRDDDLESNALTLKKLPKAVVASPDSQGFDGTLAISLSQAQGYDIYYYSANIAVQKYTSPISINSAEVGADGYTLYTYAQVIIDGVEYKSATAEYLYIPQTSACPPQYDTSIHGYHTTNTVWIDAHDTNGDGYFDDYLKCSYYYDTLTIALEEPYVSSQRHGITRYFHKNGRVSFEGLYTNNKAEGIHEQYFDNGQVSFTGLYTNDKREGIHEAFYSDGQLSGTGSFLNDYQDGLHTTYYITGKKHSEKNYKFGRYNGAVKYYYNIPDTEVVKSLDTYDNQVREGLSEDYYESGQVSLNVNYSDDRKDGLATSYYESGKVRSLITYRYGLINGSMRVYIDGTSKYYYDNNEHSLSKTIPFVNGSWEGTIIEYYSNGNIDASLEYVAGIKNGVHTYYKSTGLLYYSYVYVNDIRHGLAKRYTYNGVLDTTTPYVNGIIEGVVTEYHFDAYPKIYSITQYENNLREGSFYSYHISGNKRTTGTYINDLQEGNWVTFDDDGDMTECTIYNTGTNTGSCMP